MSAFLAGDLVKILRDGRAPEFGVVVEDQLNDGRGSVRVETAGRHGKGSRLRAWVSYNRVRRVGCVIDAIAGLAELNGRS